MICTFTRSHNKMQIWSFFLLFFETVPEEKEMLAKVLNNNKAQRLLTDAPDCRFSFAFTDRQWRRRRSAGINRRITVFTVTQLKVSLFLKVLCLLVRGQIVGSCQKIPKLLQSGAVWTGAGLAQKQRSC